MRTLRRSLLSIAMVTAISALVAAPLSIARAAHHEERPDDAPPETWNPETVTAIARDLVDVLERGAEAGQRAPEQPTVLQQRKRDAAQGAIRRARASAQVYLEAMEAGASRDESDLHFRTVREHVRAALQTADDAQVSAEVAGVLDRLREIGAELERLHTLP